MSLSDIAAELRRFNERADADRRDSPEFRAEMAAIRRPLARFSPAALIRAAPYVYADAFTTLVPREFFTQVADGSLLVACPCKVEHVVGDAGYPASAECGRYFLYDGQDVRVWRPDPDEPEPDARPES